MKLKFTCLGMLFGIAISSQITLTKDTSFGNSGIATIHYPAEMAATNFEKVFVNGDGSLNICLGTDGGLHTGMIAKLTPFGALDATFNSSGQIVLTANPNTGFEFAKQGEKIMAIYASDAGGDQNNNKIVRYTSDGHTDPSFGVNGVLAARPDLFYKQLTFQPDGIYHLWGKITGYHSNGVLNSTYGNNGNQNPIINGVPTEFMELYGYFGNRDGKNFLNKYHYEIAVSSENAPHRFTSYNLMAHHLYDVSGASSGVSVFPKKFHLTADNKVVYLFGIDPNSGTERNRFAILNETMQPKNFAGKEYIDLGEVSSASKILDVASFQNQYIFAGKKADRAVIFAYDQDGNKTTVNGLSDFYETTSAPEFSTIITDGTSIYLMGKKEQSREIFIIKYTAKVLSAANINSNKAYIVSPFQNELKIMNADKMTKVTVYDASGKSVATASSAVIPTANLRKGVYHIKLDFRELPSQTLKSIKN